MLADGEKLKKNPITPLEVNITPISQETLSSFSLFILTSSGVIGFFFNFSLSGSVSTVIVGVFFILFGIKEDRDGDRDGTRN